MLVRNKILFLITLMFCLVKNKFQNILEEVKKENDTENVDLLQVDTLKIINSNSMEFNFKDPEITHENRFLDFKSFTDFVEGKNITKQESKFNPYEDNSGTSVSIRLKDCIIIAADTRHCSEMGIYSRNTTKIFPIGNFLLTITGFYADGVELWNILKYQVLLYESFNKISIHSLANLASKIMYSKRLFPYYSYISISGFDNEEPFVYSFDCLGHFEKVNSVCNGSGSSLIQPLLDSLIEKKNWIGESYEVTEEYVKNVVKKAFDAAAERDVKTGDNLEMYIIRKDDLEREILQLRND